MKTEARNIRVWNPANPEHMALFRLNDKQLKGKGMSRAQIAAMREAQRAAPPDNLVDDPALLTPAALRAQAQAETESTERIESVELSKESVENVSRETLPQDQATTQDEPVAVRRTRKSVD